ncbi:hypothetical protein Tco_1113949 [Tanacetum coccineum]|uniref:Uncharacterized protein n=1 Tax=Tanacetum coccineum TaxID=301880 RepID=A0ABQ5ITM8_9ASTR
MADLFFADSHNMVAYLEKSKDNADFAEIVDFLNASPISGPITLVADETVHKERGDSMERAATTATNLDAEQGSGGSPRCQEAMGDTIAQTRSERVSIPSYDSPLPRVNTPGSDEERIELKELMDMCTKLFDRILDLENVNNAQALEIQKLKKRESETQGRYGHDIGVNTASTSITTVSINITTAKPVTTASAPVTIACVSVSIAEPSTPPTIITLIKDEDLTIAQTLMKMKTELDEEARLERDREEEASKAVNIAQWDDVQAMMDADYELAAKLQAEEQGEIYIEERSKLFVELMNERKKHFGRLRAEEQRRKSPTKTQKRNLMSTYLKNMAGYKNTQMKNRSFEQIQMLFEKEKKRVNIFVDMDAELVKGSETIESKVDRAVPELAAESSKRDAEEELDQESSKRQKIGESSELAEEPKDKEADELSQEELQQLALGKPTDDKEREIWVELKRLFEPDTDDELWKLHKNIHDLTWRLYDLCGVHHVSIEKGIDIYMLVEKEYLLSRGNLTLMLVAKLLVDQDNEMSRELLRKIFMQVERPRR